MTRRHPTQVAQDREHAIDVGKLRGLVEQGRELLEAAQEDGFTPNIEQEFLDLTPALLDEVERLRGALEGFERTMTRACDRTAAHKRGVIVETDDWHKLMDWAHDARLALGREVERG